MEVTLAFFFFDNTIDRVFGTAEEDLTFEKSAHVGVVSCHLQHVDVKFALVFGFRGGWVLSESCKDFTEIAHVDAAFVEEVLEAG